MIRESGVIFVMDWENYENVCRISEVRDKVFLLGTFGNKTPVEIPNPIEGELMQYVESFNYIVERISNIVAMLKKSMFSKS